MSIGLALVLVGAVSSAAQPNGRPAHPPKEPPAGEGVICAWAIYSAMAEVGARCFPGQDREFQDELARSVAELDRYVARNAPEATPEFISKFKRQQGLKDAPVGQICTGDPRQMYETIAKGGVKPLRDSIATMTARDGGPTWGTCL